MKGNKNALLVIDIQNDYFWEKRKKIFTYDTDKLVGNINKAIDHYKDKGFDIIYIKHILPKIMWGVGFSIKGTEGAELFNDLKIVGELSFEKNRSDAYTSIAFKSFMEENKYDQVYLCGIDECGCVGATAKGAVKSGTKVTMIENCIGCRFDEKKQKRMRDNLKSLGVEYHTELQ